MRTQQGEFEPITSMSLIQAVCRRDNDAWCRFVDIYGPLVYSRCRRFGLAESDCAELTSETFSKIVQIIQSFRIQTPAASDDENSKSGHCDMSPSESPNFRPWLRTVTANTVKDYLRRNRLRFVHWDQGQLEAVSDSFLNSDSDSVMEIPTDTISVHFPRSKSERTSLIAAALRARRQRIRKSNWQAFWRTTIEGRAGADVAKELGMTTKAVRQARYETIRSLREDLSGLINFDDSGDSKDSSGAVSF